MALACEFMWGWVGVRESLNYCLQINIVSVCIRIQQTSGSPAKS